jgi:hypothetical protein
MRTMWCLAIAAAVFWWNSTPAEVTSQGPTLLLQCADAAQVVSQITWLTGNTIGGARRSDGEATYPLLPSLPEITRCGEVGRFFWVENARVLGKIGFFGDTNPPDSWKRGATNPLPVEADVSRCARCRRSINSCAPAPRLRIPACRAGNDCSRGSPGRRVPTTANAAVPGRNPTFPGGSRTRQNLETLARTFHPKNDSERLMQVEMLRKLGRFDEAADYFPLGSLRSMRRSSGGCRISCISGMITCA